jgi:SAM-dependent methyltransferase
MALEVLQRKEQIEKARARLEERGISFTAGAPRGRASLWERIGGSGAQKPIGDVLKSWDVLKTAEFIEEAFPATARVLDLGAFNSEILPALHRLGFQRLSGIDMNPGVAGMPHASAIRYEVGDFLRAPFPAQAFDVVTAISVIEHGFDGRLLLTEVSRLLAPGGCFIASFDYWPEKIDTDGTKFFGMDWKIFSRGEVVELIALANGLGLRPHGALSFTADEHPIHCADRDYTFGWIALRK